MGFIRLLPKNWGIRVAKDNDGCGLKSRNLLGRSRHADES